VGRVPGLPHYPLGIASGAANQCQGGTTSATQAAASAGVPICADDEQVPLIGPDGEVWLFVCEFGPKHPRLEALLFAAS
jgi:hypothetical protein